MPLVVFNQKGGVGKSTITCNLAAISAWEGLRTLVIDLDSQGNSTRYLLGPDQPQDMPNVADKSAVGTTRKYSILWSRPVTAKML